MNDTKSFIEVITKLYSNIANIQNRKYHYTKTLPIWYDLTKESVTVYTSILSICFTDLKEYKQITMNVINLLKCNIRQFIVDDLNPIKFKLWKNINNVVSKFSCIENLLNCLNNYLTNLISDKQNEDLFNLIFNTICTGLPIFYSNKNERVDMILELHNKKDNLFYDFLKFLIDEPLQLKSLCEDFYVCNCHCNIVLFEKLLEISSDLYVDFEKNNKSKEKIDNYNIIISFLIEYQTHFLSYCCTNKSNGNTVLFLI